MKELERLEVNQRLWLGIKHIQEELNIDDIAFSRRSELSWHKFIFCKNNNLSLPFYNLVNLAGFLSLPVEKLIMGDFGDSFNSKKIEYKFNQSISPQYQTGAGSKTLTLRHLLKLARKHGLDQDILHQFSLPSIILEAKVDFEISVQLVADITDFIFSRVELSEDQIKEVALLNAFYFKDSIFGKLLKSSNSTLEIYEHLVYLTSFLENNWFYKIEKVQNGNIFLNSYPSERLMETYKSKCYSSYNFSRFRILVTGVLTRYLGLTDAKTQITKSVHFGDDYCQFLINTNNLKPLSSPQLILQ